LLQLLSIVSTLNSRLEYIYTSRYVTSWLFRVISSNCRISLLEIYIDCNRLYKVQRVIFIKRQSKSCLGVKLWRLRVLLDRLRIILAWTDVNLWIIVLLHASLRETVSFRYKTISCSLYIMGNATYHRICSRWYYRVGARAWLSTE